MSGWLAKILGSVGLIFFFSLSHANTFHVYLDADRRVHFESADSIEKGVKVAFEEVGNRLQGHDVEFIVLDHRGNSARAKRHMMQFLEDPNALVYIAGLHSPPLIKYRDYINENQLLTLVPWAAGGPITRYPSTENYVFRLSIDDTQAGEFLISQAVSEGCKRPHLLLERTPWGESNKANMLAALTSRNLTPSGISRFDWGLSEEGARLLVNQLELSSLDCFLLVSNAVEGEQLINAVAQLSNDKLKSVYSHWGLTGGGFHNRVDFAIRERVDLKILQTCFSFVSSPETQLNRQVFSTASRLFSDDIQQPSDIKAPTGFVHGYDVSRLFLAAANSVTLTDSSVENRKSLKLALENLEPSVAGLIKTYSSPFSEFTSGNMRAHEALNIDDYCIGQYDQSDVMRIVHQGE